MKRVRQSDINFKLNSKLIDISDFSIKFFTVSSNVFYILKNQDDVVAVERELTTEDEDVIRCGGTVATDYFIKLDWDELKNIGEGVLQYQATNNIQDVDYPDYEYNKLVFRTTKYYIDSDIIVYPDEEIDYKELLEEFGNRLTAEEQGRVSADTVINERIDIENSRAISAESELADHITNLGQDLTDESEVRSSADTVIITAINDEVNRAVSAETTLSTNLSSEVLRASTTEQTISSRVESYISSNDTALSNEISRATNVESGLSVSITAESERATSAETEIATDLASYISSNDNALSDEISRATAEETRLNNALTAETAARESEVTRATSVESSISGALDTYISTNNTALNNEITRATSAETAIDTKVDNYISSNNQALSDEVSRAITQENAISGKLDTYIATNNSGVTELSTALQAEVTRATNKELELSGYVDTRVEQIIGGAPAALDTLLEIAEKLADDDDAIAAIVNSITSETSARTNADSALSTRIDNLTTASTAAITAEENRAKEAESGITNVINNEILRATSAETEIEATAASNYSALTTAIGDEETRAKSVESGLNASISNEVTRATSAESAINDSISAETANRISADTAINERIDSLESATTADTSELSNKITAISGVVDTKLAISDFNSYSASTESVINSKQNAGNYVSADTFSAYTSTTDNAISSINGDITVISGVVDTKLDITAYTPSDLSNYYTKNEVDSAISEVSDSLSGYVETSAFTSYSASIDSDISVISGAVDTKLDSSAYTPTDLSNYYTKSEVDAAIEDIDVSDKLSGYVTTSAFTSYSASIDSDIVVISGVVDTKLDATAYTPSDLSNYYTKSEVYNKNEVDTAIANVDVSDQLSGYVETSAFTTYSAATQNAIDGKFDTSGMCEYYTSAQTESRIESYSGSTFIQSLVARIEELETTVNDWKNNGISAGDY